ncbi:MAG: hypothetical protein SOX32_10970, partial [Candidatus Choladocola sp.]|nr:hypothetical protein [Candidatus Choladocola sp.]
MKECEFRMIEDRNRTPGAVVEKDGVHFGFYGSGQERPVLLLYKKGCMEVEAEIPFPQPSPADSLYTMKVKIPAAQYEYNFREGDTVITDPYAGLVCGREQFGQLPPLSPHGIRGGFVTKKFDWGEDVLPEIPYEDAVMYHLHVRGFTMQKNSGVRKKGTFAGLKNKIPYLKDLGVNQV